MLFLWCKYYIVARGGKNGLKKHITSENHKKNYAAACENQRITSIFAKRRDEIHKVTYAETTFVVIFVAKNNEPLGICDGFLKIDSDISPESGPAKKYGARKTKTTDKENHFSVLKKSNVPRRVCLRS